MLADFIASNDFLVIFVLSECLWSWGSIPSNCSAAAAEACKAFTFGFQNQEVYLSLGSSLGTSQLYNKHVIDTIFVTTVIKELKNSKTTKGNHWRDFTVSFTYC